MELNKATELIFYSKYFFIWRWKKIYERKLKKALKTTPGKNNSFSKQPTGIVWSYPTSLGTEWMVNL